MKPTVPSSSTASLRLVLVLGTLSLLAGPCVAFHQHSSTRTLPSSLSSGVLPLERFSRQLSCTQHHHRVMADRSILGFSRTGKKPDSRGQSSSKHFMSDVPASVDEKQRKGILGKLSSLAPPANERKKLVPLALMFFCILFNYTILRDTKDVLMVTAPKSGAEVIPFIKTYVNLPAAIGFTGIYASMTNRMEQKDVFYTCVWPFLAFFSLFALIIYPNRSLLHPFGFCDMLASHLPAGFSAPLAIVRNWSFAAFYVMAEMWGSVVASLLFWGFANEVTTVDEAKKYYPLFGLFANVALIFSGQYVRWVSNMRATLAPGVDAWAVSLRYLMGAVLAGGGVILATYRHMQKTVVPTLEKEKTNGSAPSGRKKKGGKPKMTMAESAKFLLSSSYIRDLAMLVISYGMCINIVEVSWKAKLKQAFPNPNEYSAFMGNFSSATGAVTLIMMLLGRTIFSKFGWRVAALVTPTMLGVTGLSFFALNVFSDFFAPLTAALGTTPLMLAVLVGAAQNILSKSAKYSLFDPCKEMAYIPLDQESKTKGKAAIDVIGNPLGKSGGALIQQFLIFGVGSLAAATPYLGVILSGLVFTWIQAANSLAGQFNSAMASTSESKKRSDVDTNVDAPKTDVSEAIENQAIETGTGESTA